MSTPPGEHLYLMHGMKRSGIHALVHWLRPQIDGAFANNVVPVGSVLRGAGLPPPPRYVDWREGLQRDLSEPAQLVLATLEDHDLRLAPFTDVDVPMTRLLVLRDAAQLFSSRLRKAFLVDMPAYPRENGPVMRRAVELWKQHARCFLGDRTDFPGRIAILFDRWFVDEAYRAAISEALGVAFDDAGFGRVGGEGGGSSFDGTRFDGQGHLMAVNDRVSALTPHERTLLDALFEDRELAELRDAVPAADARALLS